MITLCAPTRGRPDRFATMIQTAHATARGDVEVIGVLDVDDPRLAEYDQAGADALHIAAPGSTHSDLWNHAWRFASGDAAMLCSDDLSFRTPGWDVAVERALDSYPDRIALVWCDDGTEFAPVATHPFVSREWINAVGRFTPPYYPAWNADSWLLDVGIKTGRLVYLDHVLIEHLHVDYGLAPDDETYARARRYRDAHRQPLDERPEFARREAEREAEARRLREEMIFGGPPTPSATWIAYGLVYQQHGYHVEAFSR